MPDRMDGDAADARAADAGRLTEVALRARIEAILTRHGLSVLQAVALARTLAAGERDGAKSHGLYRIEGVLRTVAAGKVDPRAVPELAAGGGGAIVRVEARNGFANAAFDLGLPALAAAARTHGLGALVINDCTHFSALWPEVEAIAGHGLAGLAMCPSYATVAPAGGIRPLLGTNPFAFAWPRPGRDPYVFDFATSIVARGEIELHRRAGKSLPDGWAVDEAGAPTNVPEAALAGAMLPFGGHKGSAIATMIELLAGIMIGDLTSPEVLEKLGTTSLAPMHGELVLAFDPQAFAAGRAGDPYARAERLFDAILGQGARLPSQRRFTARIEAERAGIELNAQELELLDRLEGV